ncbi:hypothetical protein Strvi_0184 (plasmid) [Streptomyces violaceusniger Tu 4113]|uniref:Uncharacterized protein n=1 Tax=Streptomyces violaceusniger (strain Tu 4113) TaxID=653045 RepID=G2PI06_STRV4|nr:hypothetical protein Strvi_0184 [Streptomyces violaceusniger Tu 4113]
MGEELIASCHRALLAASVSHPSVAGYELLLHPALESSVVRFEEEARLLPGSFGTLVGARAVIYTLGAGGSFAVFCRTHAHRLEVVVGVPEAGGAGGAGPSGP